jgi:hypothetical protein
MFFQQKTMINNVKICTQFLQNSPHNLCTNHILLNVLPYKNAGSLLTVTYLFTVKYCKIALYLVKHNFSKSLLRVGNMLIGWIFDPVKGAFYSWVAV